MILQLKWLKERALGNALPLPVDRDYTSTLRYIYTDDALRYLCSSQEEYLREIKVPEERLMSLAVHGRFLLKPISYPYALRCLDMLLAVLAYAPRPLTAGEQGSIAELEQLTAQLQEGSLEPPVMEWRDYPHLSAVYSMVGSTIDDLPDGQEACRLIAMLIFGGDRPAAWVMPEAADRVTQRFNRR